MNSSLAIREQLFRTDKSADDRRLGDNPFQGQVLACHGVPLIGGAGALHGIRCHFDLEPWRISEDEFGHLQLAASLLPGFLPNG